MVRIPDHMTKIPDRPIAVGKELKDFDSLMQGTLKPPSERDQFLKERQVASADGGFAPKSSKGYFKNPKATS